MMWHKELGTNHAKMNDYVLIAIVVFSLVGIFTRRPIAFIVVGICVAYLILMKIYDKNMDKKFELANPKTSLRLFPGEKEVLRFELQNRSLFPLVNGEFRFQISPSIKVLEYVQEVNKNVSEVKIPLSVIGKRKTIIDLPIIAEKRGTSRINNITYKLPNLFSFDSVNLKYVPFFYTEFIVFPKPLPVKGMKTIFHMIPGNQRINFSPFEDTLSPLGTRDYSYSDPFHRINWKASVKTQQLQTNVYERTVDLSFVFLVNLSVENSMSLPQLSNQMEALLSYAAYLCEYATKEGFPFELLINARKPGRVSYFHLPEGEGKTHYVNALDMMARIHKQTMVVSFKQMLYRVSKQFFQPKTIIVIGEVPPEVDHLLTGLNLQQNSLFQVITSEEEAIIKPLLKEATAYAK